MPDRHLAPRYRILLRAIRAAFYLGVAGAATSTTLWTPLVLESVLGVTLTYTWAALGVTASLTAVAGVIANRYRLEWPAAWFTAAASGAYAIAMTLSAIAGQTTLSSRAALSVAVTIALLYRACELGAHANALRHAHFKHEGQ